MSDNKSSSTQSALNQEKPSDKSKATPATAKPVTQPDQKSAEVTAAPKA